MESLRCPRLDLRTRTKTERGSMRSISLTIYMRHPEHMFHNGYDSVKTLSPLLDVFFADRGRALSRYRCVRSVIILMRRISDGFSAHENPFRWGTSMSVPHLSHEPVHCYPPSDSFYIFFRGGCSTSVRTTNIVEDSCSSVYRSCVARFRNRC